MVKKIKAPQIKKKYIPIYEPVLAGNEIKYVNDCLQRTWISSKGEYVERFEKEFAKYCKVKYAVSCSSGTSALFLALKSLQIKKGDEVIVPDFTMISSALAVSYCGAVPVFVDCRLDSGNIDCASIEKFITKKTRAIIPVDIYGTPVNLTEIVRIARKYHLEVVEDAAEAFGAEYRGKKIGGVSRFTVFSLYANKVITAGEGGMITTNSKQDHRYLKQLNNYFFSRKRHFWHKKIGYNYRLSNIQAAVGLAQLERADELVEKKQKLFRLYKENLQVVKKNFIPLAVGKNCQSNYWHVAFRVTNNEYDLMALRNLLANKGVETRGFFIPLHLQEPYRTKNKDVNYPNAEMLCQTGVLLPSGPGLTSEQIKYVCDIIISFF
ncbi:MAG: DegT/DnrJ/EryC1/StrS aminotransferase family protein [Patescibacteria group bacterium]|nr:DegT/DnrJ/EryC1/StrS aminotransferase family protein [Patescibacteria group bacterium]